jgi:hypothetical protein
VYPSEFFLDELAVDLEALELALRMGLGPTMTKRIKKKAAHRIDPDMPPDEQQKVDEEIDAMKDEPPASDMGDPEAQGIQKAEQEVTDAA